MLVPAVGQSCKKDNSLCHHNLLSLHIASHIGKMFSTSLTQSKGVFVKEGWAVIRDRDWTTSKHGPIL